MIAPRTLASLLALALVGSLTTGCGCLTHAVWNETVSNPDRILAASVDDQDVVHMLVRYDDLSVRQLSVPLSDFDASGDHEAQVVARLDELPSSSGEPETTFTRDVSPIAAGYPLLPPSARPVVVALPGAEELDPNDFASMLLGGEREAVPQPSADALQLTLTRHVADYTNDQSYALTVTGAGTDGGTVGVSDPVDPTAFRTYTASLATPVTVFLDILISPFGVGVNLIEHGADTDSWEGWDV